MHYFPTKYDIGHGLDSNPLLCYIPGPKCSNNKSSIYILPSQQIKAHVDHFGDRHSMAQVGQNHNKNNGGLYRQVVLIPL